jgi:hypothetical protein
MASRVDPAELVHTQSDCAAVFQFPDVFGWGSLVRDREPAKRAR